MKPMGTVTFFLILRNDPFFSIHSDSPELLLLSSPLHSVKNASSLSLRCLSPAATSGEETFDFCISRQDGSATPSSDSGRIEPLPGLETILEELLQEDGIFDARISRQGFEKRVVSQDLQLWLSNAPPMEQRFTLLARAGRQPRVFVCNLDLYQLIHSFFFNTKSALSPSPHHSHATLSSLTSKALFPLNIQPNHHMQTQFHHHCATKRCGCFPAACVLVSCCVVLVLGGLL
ncbi:30S ribosomal protein S1 protein [Trifolium repens]|nr:30S ribosomal protein S1 protein [Trifolium repens]